MNALILNCFLNICNFSFAPAKREVDKALPFSDLKLSDLSDSIEAEVLPILREIPPIPAGPWDSGQLYPWFYGCLRSIQLATRRFGQVVLQHLLDSYISGLDRRWSEQCPEGCNRPCPCPACGSMVWTYEGQELCPKTFKSLFEFVILGRHKAECCKCEHCFHPLDSMLGLGDHKMFPLVQRACVLLGSSVSDGVASKLLEAITGVKVCANTIRSRVKELGEASIARLDSEGPVLEFERLQSCAAETIEPVDVHGSMDGSHVPQNEKPKAEPGSHKEAYMLVVSVRNMVGKLLGKIALARQSHLPRFLLYASQLLHDCKTNIENHRYFFLHGDGATWIEAFAKSNQYLVFLLDWYHLNSNLWQLAKVLGKEATAHRRKNIEEVENLLWTGKAKAAIALLEAMRFKQKAHKAERDRIIAYISERMQYIRNYKWYYERSITIGSGEVEGAQKHLISDRLRCSGMRWAMKGSDAHIAAKCAIYNETWEYDLLQANLNANNSEFAPQTL